MASFTCHVVGGTKRVRVERSVRPPADEPNVPPWRTLRQNSPKGALLPRTIWGEQRQPYPLADRKSVVSGKSVSVRVDIGGRRIIKKQKIIKRTKQTKGRS